MSSPSHFVDRPRLPTTLAIASGALILGIPVAAAALVLENVYTPNIVLGTKEINAGPSGTKTISFSLLTGPNDAVMAGAYISIITSILFVVGLTVARHISSHNIFGWAMVFPALIDFLGNVACLAYVFIINGQHPQANSADDVQYVDGKYDTNGKLYTKEAWSCMMNKFYHDREGSWAGKACSDMKTGRLLTIPLVITSILLLGLSLLEVQRRGGIAWLFGRSKKLAAMEQSKHSDYYDMQIPK